MLIKHNNSWETISKIYKKINSEWVEISVSDLLTYMDSNVIISDALTNIVLEILSNLSSNTFTGKYFYCKSKYGSDYVHGTWSVSVGSEYASINQNGKVTINSGTENEDITILVTYSELQALLSVNVSYDNQLVIEGADTITGTSGNVIARYNSTTVIPTWSITSGNAYATIDNAGEISIISSGNITVSASYNNYTATKEIELVYDAGTTTETEVDENGNVTTTTTTTTTDPITGSSTTTTSSETFNDDGSSSSINTETIENQDGSSSTTTQAINSDGTSQTTEIEVSAPDQNGSVTSNSTTTNYDSNGSVTGSTENETTNNTDGSSSSTTINYDSNGDATDKTNENTDTAGNVNTQNIEYDGNGEEVVTGYNIDTSNNEDGTKTFNASGVNTEFYGFDATRGFICTMHFYFDYNNQPTGQNENHHNILTMKRASPSPWYGFQLRHTGTNANLILGTQFASGGNTNTNVTKSMGTLISGNKYEYNIRITYNPSLSSNKFVCYNLIKNANIYTSNSTFPDIDALKYLTVCIGYAQDENGNPYRYSNVDVIDFNIEKITS